MATDPWTDITIARQAVATARDNLIVALDTLEQARLALAAATRRQADTTTEQGKVDSATTDLTTRRQAERDARTELARQIGLWAPLTMTVEADLARLTADSPVVFFPIRVETRFGRDKNNAPALLVRVYPDEIFINLHETALTHEEYQAGIDYFNAVNATAHDHQVDELTSWRQIVQKMSPERAAYVLRRLQPDLGDGIELTFSNLTSPLPTLNFPTDIRFRSSDWTRPGEAVLPDRWVVLTTRAGVTKRTVGSPIPEPLMMTPDPSADAADLVDVPGANGKLQIDARMKWTVDYDAATQVGMAITVPLSTAEAAGGFDRVVVFGIKSSLPAGDTSTYIEQLLDAHHYTRGLAVVPQGTPTNNTEGAPTPVSQREPDPEDSFHVERDRPPTDHARALWMLAFDTDDGDLLTRTLGVPNGTFLDVENARPPGTQMGSNFPADGGGVAREQLRAAAMNDALWPVLFGHFTQQMLHWSLDQQAAARDYFVRYVRARGPAPVFRVGDVPYGVLPALSLVRWGKRTTTTLNDTRQNLEQQMLLPLQLLREKWKQAAQAGAARVKRQSTDPAGDLMRVLALQPSARQARVRTARGQLLHYHLAQFFGFDFATTSSRVADVVTGVFQSAGVSSWLGLPVASLIFDQLSSRYAPNLVAPLAQLSETAPLSGAFDCLTPLANVTSTAALIADSVLPAGNARTLLYRMLRHALLLDMIDVMVRTTRALALSVPFGIPFLELELLAIHAGSQNVAVATDMLNSNVPEINNKLVGTPIPPGSSTLTVGDFLLASFPGASHQIVTFKSHLNVFRNTPSAEVDRLFTETLDLASHRLDAWITALATRRVFELRNSHLNSQGPKGNYLGGYALLEDLRPQARTTETLPDGTTAEVALGNGGFIQAPSMSHAAAAGLLRNGHLTNSTEAGQKCAVDLSSARVRAAMLVLDELRAGQTLGAVLGYRFERRLHDRDVGLDAYRFTLRKRFPLVANKQGAPAPDASTVAATNVVDGLALWKAFTAGQLTLGPPDLTTAQVPVVTQELNALADLVDGVADLTTSEAVLQLVRGNTLAGAGNLDALPNGARPPEPEMARSVLRGRSLSYRVGLLVQDAAQAPGWPAPGAATTSPRAAVDPVLDRWVGALLGDPTTVKCTANVRVGGATIGRQVSLSQLRFKHVTLQNPQVSGGTVTASGTTVDERAPRPMDVVALARAVTQANQGSLLDRWIARVAIHDINLEELVNIDYAPPTPGDRTFPQVMELAQTVGELLAGARPLEPTDLVTPGELPDQDEAVDQAMQDGAAALDAAADAAVLAALEAQYAVDQAADGQLDLRAALESAAAFVTGAYPAITAGADELSAVTGAVSAELGRRWQEAQAAAAGITGTRPATVLKRALAKLRAVLGADFVALPAFEAAGGAELQRSFTSIASGLAGEVPDARPAPVKLLQQMAQVREPMSRWRRLSLYTRAVGAPRPRLDVAQLPHVPGERWAGLPFDKAGQTPPERGRVSVMLHSYGAAAPDPANAWSGLLVDQWSEVIPNAQEETGVAFHYDAPGAEAPQVILVVPPSSGTTVDDSWQAADIIATLNETLDLAKIRTVDAEMVDVGQLLPTIYMPENVKRPTAVTSWIGELAQAIAGVRS